MLNWVRALRNGMDYPLRRLIHWRRGGLRPTSEPKEDLFAYLSGDPRDQAEALQRRLVREYRLYLFEENSTKRNFRENLYYLRLLETALESAGLENLPDPVRAVDIGPSTWFYVQAYAACLRWWREPAGRTVTLEGYEADAWRVFSDLHSRWDYAHMHLRDLKSARYVARPFEAQPGGYDLATLFFPFVFVDDHLKWGLPATAFDPATLLRAAWDSLRPGGTVVIVNQGRREAEAQRALAGRCGIEPAAVFSFAAPVFTYNLERWVLTARKPCAPPETGRAA